MTSDCHVDDIGTPFILEVVNKKTGAPLDLSTASSLQIRFKAPGTVTVVKTATLFTDGKDGQIQYLSISGDLHTEGQWKMQAEVVVGTATWHSDVVSFQVASNL